MFIHLKDLGESLALESSLLYLGFMNQVQLNSEREHVQVSLDLGILRGSYEEGIAVFKGIPYAQAPLGNLRWQAPKKPLSWKGVKNCLAFGPVCPQIDYPRKSIYRISPRPQSEDCLYLNVWTPDIKAQEKLPVMLWIHGGNLNRGSACLPHYDGLNLAKEGVVLVSINYRVGVFGFLAHPSLSTESAQGVSGNYGLLDQIAALEWVQAHIDKFGGDPKRVTIFGESAGSWSVNALMASPLAKGLFQRAIGQSGASFYGERYLRETKGRKAAAEEMGASLMQSLEANGLEEMRDLSTEQLVEASFDPQHRFTADFVVDGWALPKTIQEIFADQSHHKVPMIIGSNDREWSGFVDLKALPKNLEGYRKLVEKRYPGKWDLFNQAYPAQSDQ
ncbi:MAG: carboxylesterase family protein, partial [Bacteroidota bacterium]